MIIDKQYEQLHVQAYATRDEMGRAAAALAAQAIRATLKQKGACHVIFAAAPSQNETLAHLLQADIDWGKVYAFHMDEYIGLAQDAPQRFSKYLQERIFHLLPQENVFCIDPSAGDVQKECARYADLLRTYPVDVVLLGIGENGHLAFNDPSVADFEDPLLVKVVQLDLACRTQQVNDGCFPELGAVPTHAITLTIPALLAADTMVCSVPGATKAQAVKDALLGPIGTACPASILRGKAGAALLLDQESASLIV